MFIITNDICTFFLKKNKTYNSYWNVSQGKIVETIESNVDVICVQEAGGFYDLFFTANYDRHYHEWTRKKYIEIKQYLQEIGESDECIKYYMGMDYQELCDICNGEISTNENNRCSLGILCRDGTAVSGGDDVIDVTRSHFHRPVLGVNYHGLPIYTVHAPSSSNQQAKKTYIGALVRTLIAKHGSKWIAVGDFNFEPQDAQAVLESVTLENHQALAQHAKICSPTVATHNGGKTIDYAIHGNDVRCAVLGVVGTTGSDHSPVLYTVEFDA
ncbi:hypothetical protein [Azospirillum argentinense]